MIIGKSNGKSITSAVNAAVECYGPKQEELIPILNQVNRSLGYLPKEALDLVSQHLKVPKSQLFSVASFYHMLSTKPRGKHIIQFCESAPCHVAGGREVWEGLKAELNLESGDTSEDGNWTLITTSCLGVCGVGPVIIVDDDIYGNVEPEQIPDILSRYR